MQNIITNTRRPETTASHSETFWRRHNSECGAAMLIVVFFFVTVSVAIVLSATLSAIAELRTYRNLATSKFAYVAAESGIEDAFYRLITEKNLPGNYEIGLNGASSTIAVANISTSEREIFASGKASEQYRKLYLRAGKYYSVNLPYGAQVGEGGVIMGNNAMISGLAGADGNLYSNGQIIGSGGAEVRGNVTVAARLTDDEVASSSACVSDEIMGQTSPKIDHAQSFVMSTTSPDSLARVSLYIKRAGNPSDATIRIVADNAGKPATTALAAQTLSYSSVNTNYAWVDINFSAPAFLNPGETYWIVFDTSAQTPSTKHWIWCRGNTDTYTSGNPLYKDNWSTAGTWTNIAGDLAFRLAYGGGTSKLDRLVITKDAKADAITNATITGDAYYQSISGSTVGGSACPNAKCHPGSPTPPPLALPISANAIAQWKSDAESGGTIGSYTLNSASATLGPKKINGDLHVENNATLTIAGTLYVTGDVIFDNNILVRCHFDYGDKGCIIVADGTISVGNNSQFAGSGNPNSFVLVLSAKQGCVGAGTIIPGCTTNNSALAISNNADGALFYADASMIDISNNAVVTAVVGYKLSLTNNTAIQYDNAILNAAFQPTATTTTPGGWNANRWNEF